MRLIRLSAGLLALSVALTACGDSTTVPTGGTSALSHDISSNDLGQALDTAPARIEVKVERGTLVAREVELKTADEMANEESVRGPVTAVSAADGSGTLTFDVGGLAVTFTSSARFRGDDDDISFDEFVTRIEEALAAGMSPTVRARRTPPAEPQAPDDATFEASDLRIDGSLRSVKLELNVDADNYAANDAPPPVAWLRVLGLEIEIRTTTEIGADDDRNEENEVRGLVASVDVDGGSITLEDGTIILVSDAGVFENEGGDDDGEHLGSLDAVSQALTDGLSVKCEAEGAVQSTNPLTLAAREVECEVRNAGEDEGDDDGERAGGMEFERAVQSVDVGAGLFVLSNGDTVQLTDTTVIASTGDLTSLQAVSDALAAGRPVKAQGRATVESAGPPATLVALFVKWEVDDD